MLRASTIKKCYCAISDFRPKMLRYPLDLIFAQNRQPEGIFKFKWKNPGKFNKFLTIVRHDCSFIFVTFTSLFLNLGYTVFGRKRAASFFADCFSRKVITVVLITVLAGCTVENQKNYESSESYEQRNVELSYRFLAHGYPEKAVKRLKKILQTNDRSVPAYNMLATVYREQGEYKLAELNYKTALELSPDAPKVRNNYGVLLTSMGRYSEAYDQFQKVTENVYYENRSEAFDNLGRVALKLGKADEAESLFRRAVRLNPKLDKTHLELARLLFEQENYLDAKSHYDHFLKLSRVQNPDSLLLGIKLAHMLGDQKSKARYIQQLTNKFSNSPEYREYRVFLP